MTAAVAVEMAAPLPTRYPPPPLRQAGPSSWSGTPRSDDSASPLAPAPVHTPLYEPLYEPLNEPLNELLPALLRRDDDRGDR